MAIAPKRRAALRVTSVALAITITACSAERDRESVAIHASGDETTNASSAEEQDVPYFIVDSPLWDFTGSMTRDEYGGDMPYVGQWTMSYEGHLSTDRSAGFSILVADPDSDAQALADQLASEFKSTAEAVTVGDRRGYAVMEDRMSSVHVLWDSGTFIVWCSGHDLSRDETLGLAALVSETNAEGWTDHTRRQETP